MSAQVFSAVFVIILVPVIVGYFVPYDEQKAIEGLTSASIQKAKTMFKGSALNERIGEKIEVVYKQDDACENHIRFSKNDMDKMSADVGDLVYLSDKRKWLGGLRSAHAYFDSAHNSGETVLLAQDVYDNGHFLPGKLLVVEKEF